MQSRTYFDNTQIEYKSISGTILYGGLGLGNVKVYLSYPASNDDLLIEGGTDEILLEDGEHLIQNYRETMTDINGNYEFTDIINGTFIIEPEKEYYYFIPSTMTVIVLNDDHPYQDFYAVRLPYPFEFYTLDLKYDPIPNTPITITTISGAVLDSPVYTDIYGYGGLEVPFPGGEYEITAEKIGYFFTDPRYSHSYIIDPYGLGGIYFYPCEFISGTISNLGGEIATVTLTSTIYDPVVTTTDINGYYEFTGIGANFLEGETNINVTYTITPSLIDYIFDPINKQILIDYDIVSNPYYDNQDFNALPLFDISGTITEEGSGDPVPSILIHLEDEYNTILYSTTTGLDGIYHFNNYPPGSYKLVPEDAIYTFDPAEISFIITNSDSINNDFTAA